MVALSFACKQCKSQVSCAQQLLNISHELIVLLIVLYVQNVLLDEVVSFVD